MRRLRYFLRIAAEGSLGGASRALGIAQPALGRQMQLLEADIGVPLFQRVPRGMRLTEEGEYLRDNIAHPLQQIDITLENVRSYRLRLDSTCTLGLQPSMAKLLGQPLIERFRAEMPNLKLKIVEDDPSALGLGLLRGTIDVGIIAGIAPDDRLFHGEMLKEPLLLVGSPQSALAGRESIAFADIGDFPLVVPSQKYPLALLLEKACARAGNKLNVLMEVDSVELAKQLASAGAGFAVLPSVLVRDECARGELVALPFIDPPVNQTIHYVVQAHWRIPLTVYTHFHEIFWSVIRDLVEEGAWPATWLWEEDEFSRLKA